jgi:hypothetical protein
VQIEVDALAPDDLPALFIARIAEFWDDDAYQAVLEAEQADIERLDGLDQTA